MHLNTYTIYVYKAGCSVSYGRDYYPHINNKLLLINTSYNKHEKMCVWNSFSLIFIDINLQVEALQKMFFHRPMISTSKRYGMLF